VGKVRDKKRKDEAEQSRRQFAHRRALAQARVTAREFAGSIRTDVDPADAIQDLLDEVHGAWQYATQRTLELDESEYFVESLGMKVPNQWIREQERLAGILLQVAAKAASVGLAERMVRLEEVQAEIFGRAVEAALQAAGLNFDQRQVIHQKIAEGLDDVEGIAQDLPPLQVGKKTAA
jgi:hypothetical protein